MLKVCIVGLGQMGGSLGLALKKNSRSLKNCYRITGIGRRKETLDAALKLKAVDKTSLSLPGKIKGIKYKKSLEKNLIKFNLENFDINSSPSSSLIFDKQNLFAISKWVSPKRTRSYPYKRIYDTIHISKKITVISAVKDEGKSGDRDFLQWDTVSMMSLLDVYVIFAYYSDAEKLENKIAEQKFDNNYVISKIKEIEGYHSSGLHWNLKELADLHFIADKIQLFKN